jgi:hypothetical protein
VATDVGSAAGMGVFRQSCDTLNASDEPNATDFGVVAGAGLAFHRFSASVRYEAGLTDIYSAHKLGTATIRNTALLFLLGVRL